MTKCELKFLGPTEQRIPTCWSYILRSWRYDFPQSYYSSDEMTVCKSKQLTYACCTNHGVLAIKSSDNDRKSVSLVLKIQAFESEILNQKLFRSGIQNFSQTSPILGSVWIVLHKLWKSHLLPMAFPAFIFSCSFFILLNSFTASNISIRSFTSCIQHFCIKSTNSDSMKLRCFHRGSTYALSPLITFFWTVASSSVS